jgi:FlaA1/EpsC-like NDP-sugar epimerase
MSVGGDVFVLDMGQPVKIIDLAKRMVQLSGLTLRDANHPDGDIDIAVTGLRPGEKLFEELLIGDNPETTAHPRIMKAHEDRLTWAQLSVALDTLRQAAQQGNVSGIKAVLRTCVNGYVTESANS